MKICQCCFKEFPNNLKIEGIWHSFSHRKFCLDCSPFGTKDCRHPKDRLKDLDGMRLCYSCQQRKPLALFSISTTEKTKHRWLCKACASLRTIAQQKSQKQKCIAYKGGKCEICGYNKCARSLHFHHKNPEEKDFTLAKYRMRAWETVKTELDKCLLVCANCHGEIHDGIILV